MRSIDGFLFDVQTWAEGQDDLEAILLVGSYARNQARYDSDIDLVLLTHQPNKYVTDSSFARNFGSIMDAREEDWGRVTSKRIWFRVGFEVEFGITTPDWITEEPLDAGTVRVIRDGARVLFDRIGHLEELVTSVRSAADAGNDDD